MTAWEALKAAITGAGATGEEALADASDAAANLANGLNTAGAAAKGAGAKTKAAADEAKAGWAAVAQTLADYSKEAMNWGKGLGSTLVDAFNSAESAFRQFVTTGKFDFKSLVSSMLADLAVLSFKRAVLGPIANALSLFMGPAPGSTASILHAGGLVGAGGPSRAVPTLAFADAPRMHAGGWAGLKPDEVPAILQRGERVLSRRHVAQGDDTKGAPGVSIAIDARGAQMGVAEQIDAKLRAAIPQIERIAKQAVADGRRRGHAL
jgi:phage-related minor tail protein